MLRLDTAPPLDVPLPVPQLKPDQIPATGIAPANLAAPMVIRGWANAWPAVQAWTFPALSAMAASQGVTVQAAHTIEEREQTHKSTVPLSAYLDAVHAGSTSAGYVKQLSLLAVLPDLKQDLGSLPFSSAYWSHTMYAWIGGPGSMTGLHDDDEDNVLIALHGKKHVRLAAPSAAAHLHIGPKYDSGTRCAYNSLFDAAEVARIRALQVPVYDVILEPGDALLFPRYWWHEVLGIGPNIALNVFVSTLPQACTVGVCRGVGIVLHELGWWKSAECVCHGEDHVAQSNGSVRRGRFLAVLASIAAITAAVLR